MQQHTSQLNILLYINRTTENKCTFQWLDIDLMSFLKRMSMILSLQYIWDRIHIWPRFIHWASASMIFIQHDFRKYISDDTKWMHKQTQTNHTLNEEHGQSICYEYAYTYQSDVLPWDTRINKKKPFPLRFGQIDTLSLGSKTELMLTSMMTGPWCMGSKVWMNRSCSVTKNRRKNHTVTFKNMKAVSWHWQDGNHHRRYVIWHLLH